MPTFDSDKAMSLLGVSGRLTHRTTKEGKAPGLWFRQRWISEARRAPGYGAKAQIRAELRFDDECGNGRNSFAITGDVWEMNERGRRVDIAGGCLHEDIAKAFPELAPLIRWHLFDQSGPMHYIANTVYNAGDRDHWGARKGEPFQWETAIHFGANPIKHRLKGKFVKFLQSCAAHPGADRFDLSIIEVPHKDRPGESYKFAPHYTVGGYAAEWHECPFDDRQKAEDFITALKTCDPQFVRVPTAFGEGKARDLAAARSCAVWPDAPESILCGDPAELRAALEARLPALVAEFRADMESAGFLWSPDDYKAEG